MKTLLILSISKFELGIEPSFCYKKYVNYGVYKLGLSVQAIFERLQVQIPLSQDGIKQSQRENFQNSQMERFQCHQKLKEELMRNANDNSNV